MEALLVIYCTLVGLSVPAIFMLLWIKYQEFVKALHQADEVRKSAEKMLCDLQSIVNGLTEKQKDQKFRMTELEQIISLRVKK